MKFTDKENGCMVGRDEKLWPLYRLGIKAGENHYES